MALYNLKNPAVKRLMKEAEELRFPTEEYYAQPLEDNLFEWHFTLRGPPNSEFDGGIYHGRITLPPEYPMKPPSIILLTPNGRFEINKKICLSISGHHPESWQPSWSIRTALLAIIGFLPTHGNGAIGSLDYTPEERKKLAEKSQNWKCSDCGYIKDFLKKDGESSGNTIKVLEEELKPEKESEIVEDSPSDTTDLLPQNMNLNHENQSVDKTDKLLLNGTKVHSKHIPHYESIAASSEQDFAFPRHRHLNPKPEKQNVEPSTSENKISKSDDVKHLYNYCSLFVIWVLVVILVILVARRLLYQ